MKSFFENIKWYEWVIMAVFIVILVAVSVVEHSSIVVIFNSLIGVVAIFFISKGLIVGKILGIIQGVFYCVLSAQSRYFGELIVCACVSIPLSVVSVFTWIKNRQGKNVVKINQKVFSLFEWIMIFVGMAVVGVGVYYILKAFDTLNPLLSTISAALTMTASYLLVRRCEYNFVFYILSNMIGIVLWISVIVKTNSMESLPTVLTNCIFLILNAYGIVNWLKMKKTQKNCETASSVCNENVAEEKFD